MTSQLPLIVLVMISDEQAAGRIVVELGALVRFNATIDHQLAELETRLQQLTPQLARRGCPRCGRALLRQSTR